MNELCVPIPFFKENQVAEVSVTVNGKKREYHFKVESFPWRADEMKSLAQDRLTETALKVQRLKSAIENYDKSWEIVQIYTPSSGSEYIQVLFRQKVVS
jgi:hypothetical protein